MISVVLVNQHAGQPAAKRILFNELCIVHGSRMCEMSLIRVIYVAKFTPVDFGIWGFPKIGGTVLGDPNTKDYRILGSLSFWETIIYKTASAWAMAMPDESGGGQTKPQPPSTTCSLGFRFFLLVEDFRVLGFKPSST